MLFFILILFLSSKVSAGSSSSNVDSNESRLQRMFLKSLGSVMNNSHGINYLIDGTYYPHQHSNLTQTPVSLNNTNGKSEKLQTLKELHQDLSAKFNIDPNESSEDNAAYRELKSHHLTDLKNGRRQSFFPGFNFPNSGLGYSNPLGMLRPPSFPLLPSLSAFPTLPQLSSFPLIPPRPLNFPILPPRPPKSSIIGNNGGPMALTNDNVVVVNVLSSNF